MSYSLVGAKVDMALSSAVLTVDERIEDCSLVMVNLNLNYMTKSDVTPW